MEQKIRRDRNMGDNLRKLRLDHDISQEKLCAEEGDLPKKALELVLEWNDIHKDALLKIWETQEFIALSPLE